MHKTIEGYRTTLNVTVISAATTLLVAVMMTALLARPAAAQIEDDRKGPAIDLGLAWGRYDPDGQRLSDDDLYGLRLGLWFSRLSSTLGLEVAADRFQTTDLRTRSEIDMTFLDFSAKHHLKIGNRVQGFLIGGPGWVFADSEDLADGRLNELEDSLSFHFGAGLDLKIEDRWSLQPELRLRWREQDGFEFESYDLSGTLTVRYRFGLPGNLAPRPLPVSLTKVAPAIGNEALYEPQVARTSEDETTYRLRLRAWFRNSGSTDLILQSISVLPALPPGSFVRPKTELSDEVFKAGKEAELELPQMWGLPAAPRALTATLTFEGPTLPVVVEIPLTDRRVSYSFPSRAEELGANEYWTTGRSWHKAACGTQAFAHDFGAMRWDSEGKQWIAKSGDQNSDYVIWNLPVHALAGGTILECVGDHPENPRPGEKLPFCSDTGNMQPCRSADPGGNYLIVLHNNGEEAKYSHFRNGSLSQEIYPRCQSQRVRVEEGQLLGRVGNSGNSSGPHLHVVVRRDDPSLSGRSECPRWPSREFISLPFLFHNGHAIDRSLLEPDGAQAWAPLDGTGLRLDMAILPPGCGNGIRENGERCDGNDVGIGSCRTFGAGGGDLRCKANCRDFDRSACDFPNCLRPGEPGCSCLPVATICRLGEDGCYPDGPGGPDLYCEDSLGDNGSVCSLTKIHDRTLDVCRACPELPAPGTASYGCPCTRDRDCRSTGQTDLGGTVPLACWGSTEDGWARGTGVCLPKVNTTGIPGENAADEFERTRWLCKSNCEALGVEQVCLYDPTLSFHAVCVDTDGCAGSVPGDCESQGGRCGQTDGTFGRCTDECDPNKNQQERHPDCERWGYPAGYSCTEWGRPRCVPSVCARDPIESGLDLSWCRQFATGD